MLGAALRGDVADAPVTLAVFLAAAKRCFDRGLWWWSRPEHAEFDIRTRRIDRGAEGRFCF